MYGAGGPSRHISYLPLAHIYERFNVTMVTHYGGAIGFYRGNVLELLEDVEELQPTIFASVPRLYNRIYDKVLAQVMSISNTLYDGNHLFNRKKGKKQKTPVEIFSLRLVSVGGN